MKKILILLVLPFFVSVCPDSCQSQKPEKVYSIAKVQKPFEWYKTQAQLWKKEIDKNKKNNEAWLNFYTANRMAYFTNQDEWKNLKGDYFKPLDEIVDMVEKAIPNSFESYYIKIYNSGRKDESIQKLIFKAHELDPDRVELLDEMQGYYEEKRDIPNRKKISWKWYESNDISPYIINFNYNVLMSMDDDAIIITNGDMDTYPIWLIQDVFGIKQNVYVMNIGLITIDEYRSKLFAETGIPEIKFSKESLKGFSDIGLEIKKRILKHILENSRRPVYMATTLSRAFYSEFESNLYLVGLALKYSKTDFDNMALLRRSYEKKFMVDYLKMNFYNDISFGVVSELNAAYLPGFMKLCEHYKTVGEGEKNKDLKELVCKILIDAGRKDEIDQWLKNCGNN